MHIFISYSNKSHLGKTLSVLALMSYLNSRLGDITWIDMYSPPDVKWTEIITDHIKKSDVFVLLITWNTVQSLSCKQEWEIARAPNKLIVPLIMEDAEFPIELQHYRSFDLRSSPENTYQDLSLYLEWIVRSNSSRMSLLNIFNQSLDEYTNHKPKENLPRTIPNPTNSEVKAMTTKINDSSHIRVEWDNQEKTVVRFTYTGKWTWDEFYIHIKKTNEMMDTVDHICVSIVDMSNSGNLPLGASVHIRNIIRQSMSHNNSGISVFINAETLVKMIIDALRMNYPDIKDFSNFIYAKSIEEARIKALAEVKRLDGDVLV